MFLLNMWVYVLFYLHNDRRSRSYVIYKKARAILFAVESRVVLRTNLEEDLSAESY